MEKTVQAVYEQGVLHLLEPLPLEERQRVTVTISDAIGTAPGHPLLVSPDEWAGAANDDVSLDEVRSALSTIRGSLSEAVLEERRERWLPGYYFDTSALAKLYRLEVGSDFVDRLHSERDSRHLISRLAIVEMESVFALKIRTGEIDHQAALTNRSTTPGSRPYLGRGRLLVAAVNDEHFRNARQLLFKYGVNEALRTLDALQVSVAVGLKRAGLATTFVAADQKLCRVAALEGFAVTNPEEPASLVIWNRYNPQKLAQGTEVVFETGET
jgi:predicted nucleic acid-binding protein